MVRSFGKYRSRRKPSEQDEEKHEPEQHEPKKQPKKQPRKKPVKAKKVIPKQETESESEASESEDDLGQIENDSKRVAGGLLPNRLHVQNMSKSVLTKMVSVMDDHDFKGLKHGAKYILGHPTNVVHHHRHRGTQHPKHFQKIARASREQLTHDIHHGSEDLMRAVHESIHSAKVGGGFSFDHVHHIARHIHHPITGGSLKKAFTGAKALAALNPIKSLQSAKKSYDKIDLHDWSDRGMLNNTLNAYSGNFHVGAAHLKGASAVAAATLVGSPAALLLEPAAIGMDFTGDLLSTS